MIDIFTFRFDRTRTGHYVSTWKPYVTAARQQAAGRFRRSVDACRTILGEMLARYAIISRTSAQNRELVFARDAYRKPYLRYPHGCHFNISHAGDWVVCAFGRNPIGIDVEQVKPIDLALGERFFAPDEYEALKRADAREQLSVFYRIWTLKESYLKAVGKGLSIPLDSFCVRMDEVDESKAELAAGSPPASFELFALDRFHLMSLCKFVDEATNVIRVREEELYAVARSDDCHYRHRQ